MENNIQNPDTGDKTFTQEQVNAIVGERLAKEKAKTEAVLAQREQELAKRELMLTAKEKAGEMGLPVEILGVLNISDPETLDKSLETIKKVIEDNKPKAPNQIVNYTPAYGGIPDDKEPLRKAMGLK